MNMRLLYNLAMTLVALGAAAEPNTSEVGQITLCVDKEARQTLEGFGCSLANLSNARIPDAKRAQMFDRVFRDLQMNVLRLWMGVGADVTTERMKSQFYATYVDDGIIAEAQKRGVNTLLLAPASHHLRPAEALSEYSRKLADLILALRIEHRIRINVTGINNEPGSFTPQELTEVVRLLRADLDVRGLQDVAIIAPESASADAAALKDIVAIRSDSTAWAALRGIATHSYNMAATPEFAAAIG